MLIRKLSHGVYDVFGDVGFDNWTRVRKMHWGIKIVAGVALPRGVAKTVFDLLEHNPSGSLENI